MVFPASTQGLATVDPLDKGKSVPKEYAPFWQNFRPCCMRDGKMIPAYPGGHGARWRIRFRDSVPRQSSSYRDIRCFKMPLEMLRF